MVQVALSFSVLSPVLGGDGIDVTVFPLEQRRDLCSGEFVFVASFITEKDYVSHLLSLTLACGFLYGLESSVRRS